MSGELHQVVPHPPLMALIEPDKAATLLEDVIFERVVGCIDQQALEYVTNDLRFSITDRGLLPEPEARKVASDLVAYALMRFARDAASISGGVP